MKMLIKVVGFLTLLAVCSSTQAYTVVKRKSADRKPKKIVTVEKLPAKVEFSASSQGYTDRKLLVKDTPDEVVNRPAPDVEQEALPKEEDFGTYIMCPGDKVQINVMGYDDIFGDATLTSKRGELLVRPDGKLMLPLIGDVKMAGKSVEQNVKEITQRFSEYLVDPQVTINITQLGTTRVYVFGEIKSQGMFELSKSHNLIDALGAAGGFTAKSRKNCVYVLRKNHPDFVLKVNMLELFRKNDTTCNPMLREGDVVYISSNHKFLFTDLLSVVSRTIGVYNDIDYFSYRKKN